MADDKFKQMVDKIWPRTKLELEKGLERTKKALSEGEKYLKEVSHESAENIHQLSLQLKRERAFYELGKTVVRVRKTSWATDKKIAKLTEEIKKLSREIKKAGK